MPRRAKAIGLVIDVVPSGELMDRVHAIAAQITKTSQQSAAAIKRVLRAGTNLVPSVISALEEEAFASLLGTDDPRRRMRAFLASQAGSELRP
jgi:enoyl-CoA hydratase/carnithine racemase